jgi:hypothetical protein
VLDGCCGRAPMEGLVAEVLVVPNQMLLLRRDVV